MTLQELKQEIADAKDNGQGSFEIVFEDIDKLVAVAEAANAVYISASNGDPGQRWEVDDEEMNWLERALKELTSDEGGEE